MLSASTQIPSVTLGRDEDGVWSCLYIHLVLYPPPGHFGWTGFPLVCGWASPSLRVILGEHRSPRAAQAPQAAGERKKEILAMDFFVLKGKGFSPSHREGLSREVRRREFAHQGLHISAIPRRRLLQPHGQAVTGCLPSLTHQRTF